MEPLTPVEVLEAARAVDDAWPVPAAVEVVETDDFVVLCRPAHMSSPTSGRVQAWLRSSRSFSQVRAEVDVAAGGWGVDEVRWWVQSEVRPSVDEALRSAGAELAVTQLLMARRLEGHDADAWLARSDPPGAAVSVVADRASFRALNVVEEEGWGRPPSPLEALDEEWEWLRADLDSSAAFALLARADGTPAAVGRCRLFNPVLRPFGAVTLPTFRGRGLYGSLLRARCRIGRGHGATLALTKGRPDTSVPLLERAGFQVYQTERCWRLPADRSR